MRMNLRSLELQRDAFYEKYAILLEDEENVTFVSGEGVYIDVNTLEDIQTIRFLLGVDVIISEYSIIVLDDVETRSLIEM